VLKVDEQFFHMKCLKCAVCELKLDDKCFSRDGRVYCREDFFRQFGTKCSGCGNGIPPTESVRRAHHSVYHLKCFMCQMCHLEFQTGDEFYLMEDKKLICKTDYENAKAKGINFNTIKYYKQHRFSSLF
jgi:LIM homeobox protein 3/4